MNRRHALAALPGLMLATGALADDPKPQPPELAPLPRPVRAKARKGDRPGEVITPAARSERLQDRLKVGDVAPNFTLKTVDGKRAVTLSDFQDHKPVVLIFASYT